jgi:hypothetical protein
MPASDAKVSKHFYEKHPMTVGADKDWPRQVRLFRKAPAKKDMKILWSLKPDPIFAKPALQILGADGGSTSMLSTQQLGT